MSMIDVRAQQRILREITVIIQRLSEKPDIDGMTFMLDERDVTPAKNARAIALEAQCAYQISLPYQYEGDPSYRLMVARHLPDWLKV